MEKSEKLNLDAKQRHLAKLKKQLAKQERKLERSLRVSQAKEHVRKKLKEQALIEAAENQSLMKENSSFHNVNDQSLDDSCLSHLSYNDSITVTDLSSRDITLSELNQGDITLSNDRWRNTPQRSKGEDNFVKDESAKRKTKHTDNLERVRNPPSAIGTSVQKHTVAVDSAVVTTLLASGTISSRGRKLQDTPVIDNESNIHRSSSKQYEKNRRSLRGSVKEETSQGSMDARSPKMEGSASAVTVIPDSPNFKMEVADNIIHKRSAVKKVEAPSLQRRSPSTQSPVLNIKNASFSNRTPSSDIVKSPRLHTVSSAFPKRSSSTVKPSASDQRSSASKKSSTIPKSPANQNTLTNKKSSQANQTTSPAYQKLSTAYQKTTPAHQKSPPAHQKTLLTHQTTSSAHQMTSPAHKKSSPAYQKTSLSNQKTSTANQKTSSTNQIPTPAHQKSSPAYQKTSLSNQKMSPTKQIPSPVNQKISLSNQKTSSDYQKQSPFQKTSPVKQKTSLSNQKTSPAYQKQSSHQMTSPVNQKRSPVNQNLQSDDSVINQSSLEISRASLLNDSLSLTPTFSDDGVEKDRRKVCKPHFQNRSNDAKQKLNFQDSEIEFKSLKSDHHTKQNKKNKKHNHEIFNFDTIEFVSQTKPLSKREVKGHDHQPRVNHPDPKPKTKLKEVQLIKSETDICLDLKSVKSFENLHQKYDKDVKKLSQDDLNFGMREGMVPDLPILILDRKSKRRSRNRRKSGRQTSSPNEVSRSSKISNSGATQNCRSDSRIEFSNPDSLEAHSSKFREWETPVPTKPVSAKNRLQQAVKKVGDEDAEITEISESDSQVSVSILVDTSKSVSSSLILDEKISIIESGEDNFSSVSMNSVEDLSQSLLRKDFVKDCARANDSKTKSDKNLKKTFEMFVPNSPGMMPSSNPENLNSNDKISSQSSQFSDSLSLKRRKFKQRKRSLSHGKGDNESLGSSQDSKRIKVSDTSHESNSLNCSEESMSSKSSRKANKVKVRPSQDSIKMSEIGDDTNSQNSNLSRSSKTSRHHKMSAAENETLHSKPNNESSQFSEFTELDVVEFSQFKFSEEFLTENSENSQRGRKRKRHPSYLGMIVQRRSPRVSSLVDSESSSNSCSENTRYRTTRQDKCLMISSLFQYLVDEIKRKAEIVEFHLPDSQFKNLVDLKILENNFEVDHNPSVMTSASNISDSKASKIDVWKSSNVDKYNKSKVDKGETLKVDKCDELKIDKCDELKVDKCDKLKVDKCDKLKGDKLKADKCDGASCEIVHQIVTSTNSDSVTDDLSQKTFINYVPEIKDTMTKNRHAVNRHRTQNSQKLNKPSQSPNSSACKISQKSKPDSKLNDSRRVVKPASDIDVINNSEPINDSIATSDNKTSNAKRENLTEDLENDIKVIYDSEPIPDDSMSEETCYHRNDATDLQENDLSAFSEKLMKENEDEISEDILNKKECDKQKCPKVENPESESVASGGKLESTTTLLSAIHHVTTDTLQKNFNDSEVTFKPNIQVAISTPKFSSKIRPGQSNNQFRNSTSTPKRLIQAPKTPNLGEVASSTPKTASLPIEESFETPKSVLSSKRVENLDAFTTPKDANIRRHFDFADNNFSPPLFPTQKDLTPVGIRRLDDETLDSFIQLEETEAVCDDLIAPTECIKLCRDESVVFISSGTWTSEGQQHSYIVCLLPSAISVWSQGEGQWENELDWYLSQTYQAMEGWIIKKPNKVVMIILEEDKSGEQRVSLFYYDLLSGDSNMSVIELNITQTNPITSLLCCIVNGDQLIIGYNHCTSLTATKHILVDGYKQMSLCCHLESTSGYLMDITEVRHLAYCVMGLTSKREALIWNHEEGFLIKKINLDIVITQGVSLTAVQNIQGYLLCHLVYRVKSDCPGYVIIVNISNNSSLILHDYQSLQFSWKGLKNVVISEDSLLASDIHGNTGLWDMISGELLADIPRSKVTCGNINQSEKTIYLGLDGGAVQFYPIESVSLKI